MPNRKESEPERYVREELTLRNIEFVQEYPVKQRGFNYYLDFYLPWENISIDIDGDYWHDLPEQQKVDLRKNEKLRELGYRVIRFTETEVLEDVQLVVDKALKEAN